MFCWVTNMLCMGLIKWNLIQQRKSLHIYKSKVSFIMLPFYKTTCFDQYRIGRRDDTSVYLVGVFFNIKQMWGKVHYEFSLLWCYTAWCSDKEPRKFSNALVQAGIIYFIYYVLRCTHSSSKDALWHAIFYRYCLHGKVQTELLRCITYR